MSEKKYFCNVKTDECTSRSEVKVSGFYLLNPNTTETNTIKRETGDRVEFRCSGDGKPAPLFFWRFTKQSKSTKGNNTTPKPETPKTITNMTENSTSYTIDTASKNDAGKYECVAKIGGSINKVIKIVNLSVLSSDSDDGLKWWEILLIALGAVIAVVLIIIFILVLCKKGVCPDCCTCCRLPSICPAEKSTEIIEKRDPERVPISKPTTPIIRTTEHVDESVENDPKPKVNPALALDMAKFTKPGALPPMPGRVCFYSYNFKFEIILKFKFRSIRRKKKRKKEERRKRCKNLKKMRRKKDKMMNRNN